MNYISLFSGIEAATVAWEPLGWHPVAFSEVEPFCCDLLKLRFPTVPNLGDVKTIEWGPYGGAVDIVVGGSPCQAFSVAGNRRGLMDERSALMLEYIRAIHDIRPRWLLWENVPGVLSQSKGEAFETLLDELENCGYSLAWRVLDAQFYGVAQRRRRVFVIGNHRPERAAAVLFDTESLRWNHPSSRAKRASLTEARRGRAEAHDRGETYAIKTSQVNQNGTPFSEELAHTLDCATPEAVAFAQNSRDEVRIINTDGSLAGALCAETGSKQQTYVAVSQYGDVAGTLTARYDSSPCADRGENIIAFQAQASMTQGLSIGDTSPTLDTSKTPVVCIGGDHYKASIEKEMAPTMTAHDSKGGLIAAIDRSVRRLTPVECERLQGFPDDWTNIYPERKNGTPDGPRFKALGNSMAVPVIQWLGRRIELVESLTKEKEEAYA